MPSAIGRCLAIAIGLVAIGCASGGVEQRRTVNPEPAPPLSRTPTPVSLAEPSPNPGKGPGFVYAEELPEAIERYAPEYPEAARANRVEGTVMVRALVGVDGSVSDTALEESIPEVDQAAMDCVKRWRFKPARNAGSPVAVWVSIPIRFSLH